MGRLYSPVVIIIIIMLIAGSVEALDQAQGSIRIEPLPEQTGDMSSAVVAEEYSCVFEAHGGHGYGYAWGHSVLPVGLILQMDAEVEGKVYIEGIPEKEGRYEITVKATDVVDSSMGGEFHYTLTVSPNPAAAE
ncbi:MAG: hypothetical protein WC683_03230 [bacterium]